MRTCSKARKTNETEIVINLSIDGVGKLIRKTFFKKS